MRVVEVMAVGGLCTIREWLPFIKDNMGYCFIQLSCYGTTMVTNVQKNKVQWASRNGLITDNREKQ